MPTPAAASPLPPWVALGAAYVCAFAYYLLTASWDLVGAGEARAAEIAREMIERGDPILPALNGVVGLDSLTKPPLYHWLLAIAGSLTAWSNAGVHAVSQLSGLAGLYLVYRLGRDMFGPRVGAYAALVLASSYLYLIQTATARIDALFAVLILAALSSLYRATRREDRTGPLLWGYLWMALAVLTKGPAGLAIPLVSLLIYVFAIQGPRRIGDYLRPWPLLLSLLLASSWYLLVFLLDPVPDAERLPLIEQLENWWRGAEESVRPLFYLPYLIVGLFPWSLFLPPALWASLRQARRDRPLLLLLIWSVGGLLLFSLGVKKAARYLLPILPALALIVAYYLDRLRLVRGRLPGARGAALLVGLIGVALMAVLIYAQLNPQAIPTWLGADRNLSDAHSLHRGQAFLAAHAPAIAALLGLLILLAALADRALARHAPGRAVLILALCAVALTLPYTASLEREATARRSPRAAAEYLTAGLPQDHPAYIAGDAYHHAFLWYAHRHLVFTGMRRLPALLRADPETRIAVLHEGPLSPSLLALAPHRQWPVDYYTVTVFRPPPAR